MSPKTAVIVFPGSNCDQDCLRSWQSVTGLRATMVWHKETSIDNYDFVIIPGGFSFGDYLRTGAIARFSPIMNEVIRLANRGNLILGICNGFQILTEARLLPGALLRNRDLKYLCKDTHIRVENNSSAFTSTYKAKQVLRIPISHGEGNYTVSPKDHKKLLDQNLVAFRYCDAQGQIRENGAPNGSFDNIAGIISEKGNVLGMMPHPERLAEEVLGGTDGRHLLQSILDTLNGGRGL